MRASIEGSIGQQGYSSAGQLEDAHGGPSISLQRKSDRRLGIEGVRVDGKLETDAREFLIRNGFFGIVFDAHWLGTLRPSDAEFFTTRQIDQVVNDTYSVPVIL